MKHLTRKSGFVFTRQPGTMIISTAYCSLILIATDFLIDKSSIFVSSGLYGYSGGSIVTSVQLDET